MTQKWPDSKKNIIQKLYYELMRFVICRRSQASKTGWSLWMYTWAMLSPYFDWTPAATFAAELQAFQAI